MEEIIKNECLEVKISLKGALLTSIKDLKNNNFELLYQIEKDSWPFQDVQIFPLIGKGEYIYNNKKYEFETRHGFIRNSLFKIKERKNDSLTLIFSSNEETYKVYPFNFTFLITFSLNEYTLNVKTKIINNAKDNYLYCAYGSHTGLKASSLNGKILFDKEILINPLFKDGLINFSKEENLKTNEISLFKDTFKKFDTLVLKNKYSSIILDNGFNYLITYNFNDAPYLAIWSNMNKGEFVCVEPWWGISNYTNELNNIKDIKEINIIKNEKEFSYSFSFKYLINK